MRKKKKELPTGWTASDVRRVRDFVRQSKGIPQLTQARTLAVCMLWNLTDGHAPELGQAEIEEVLKTSDRYIEVARLSILVRGKVNGKPSLSRLSEAA